MPNDDPFAPSIFHTYQDLLDALTEATMVVIRRVHAELSPKPCVVPALSFHLVVRHQVVLSLIVRRAVMVSRYIETLPAPLEQRLGRILPALDRVFAVLAAHQIDVDTYHAALDAEIDGDNDDDEELDEDELEEDELEDDELEDDELRDELEAVDREYADIPGRPPAALVAELCRDFGMAMYALPTAWSDPVPADLRDLCLRAAVAAVRPNPPSGDFGYSLAS